MTRAESIRKARALLKQTLTQVQIYSINLLAFEDEATAEIHGDCITRLVNWLETLKEQPE